MFKQNGNIYMLVAVYNKTYKGVYTADKYLKRSTLIKQAI